MEVKNISFTLPEAALVARALSEMAAKRFESSLPNMRASATQYEELATRLHEATIHHLPDNN